MSDNCKSSCEKYCKSCAELTDSMNKLRVKGNGNDYQYYQLRTARMDLRKQYMKTYLQYIQAEYPDTWQQELVDRYQKYKPILISSEESPSKTMLREEYMILARLTLQLKLRTSSFKRKTHTENHRKVDTEFSELIQDRRQFIQWARGEDNDSEHQLKTSIIMDEINKISPSQRRVAELVWIQGMNQTEAAKELGISKSTVSRNLTRARKTISFDMENVIKLHRRDDSPVLDLGINQVYEDISGLLTYYQKLLIQLYYADGWKISDIGDVIHRNRSTISRTLRRAVCRIMNYAKRDELIIYNFEVLTNDITAYWMPRIEDGTFYEALEFFRHAPNHHRFFKEFEEADIDIRYLPFEVSYGTPQKKSKLSYAIASYSIKHQG